MVVHGERITVICTFDMLSFSISWENIFIKVVLLYNAKWLMCFRPLDLSVLCSIYKSTAPQTTFPFTFNDKIAI